MRSSRTDSKSSFRAKTRNHFPRNCKKKDYLQTVADFIWFVPKQIIDLASEKSLKSSTKLKQIHKDESQIYESESMSESEQINKSILTEKNIMQKYKLSPNQFILFLKLQKRIRFFLKFQCNFRRRKFREIAEHSENVKTLKESLEKYKKKHASRSSKSVKGILDILFL